MHNFLYCLLYFFKQRKNGRRKSLHTFQFKNPFVFFFCNREKKIGTGVEVTIIYTANALY